MAKSADGRYLYPHPADPERLVTRQAVSAYVRSAARHRSRHRGRTLAPSLALIHAFEIRNLLLAVIVARDLEFQDGVALLYNSGLDEARIANALQLTPERVLGLLDELTTPGGE